MLKVVKLVESVLILIGPECEAVGLTKAVLDLLLSGEILDLAGHISDKFPIL